MQEVKVQEVSQGDLLLWWAIWSVHDASRPGPLRTRGTARVVISSGRSHSLAVDDCQP